MSSIETTTPAVPARRGLLGLTVAALATPALIGRATADTLPAIDLNVLNFALNLEYLEAEYYLRGAFGRGLNDNSINGFGTPGGVTGGRQVNFATPVFREYAEEIASDEENHVRFIRRVLGGGQRVARPQIDLTNAFNTLGRASGLVGPTESFDPFLNEHNFLIGAFVFEDVGVTAYKGAARLLENKDVLEAAAGILAVEAYHSGEIRTLLVSRGEQRAARLISRLRDAADGPEDLDQDIWRNGRANIVPTDNNGLAFSRNTDQVLNIVYLGGAAAGFGFFPNRLNGAIK
jgi:hypothetical protein